MKLFIGTAIVSTMTVQATAASSRVNPIRKVVTMLQNVQKKVEAEGKKEEELFNKFMCYCKTGRGSLEKSVADAEAKIPQVKSAIEESIAQEAQLKEDLKQHAADRAAAKTAIGEATGIREKEAAAYKAMKEEVSSNVAAMNKAVAALEKGTGAAFLQTSSADVLRNLMKTTKDMDPDDAETVTDFMQSSQNAGDSGQIIGILKTTVEEMNAGLAAATKKETETIAAFEELLAARKKEIAAATKAIEEKTVRVGEIAVSIAQIKNDLADTEGSLVDDMKFLEDLKKNCKTKAAEWDEIVKVRAEEQVALADTIKMLNSDDALEMFKKALPGAASSFVQMQETRSSVRARAITAIQSAKSKRPNLNFITLALRGKKVGFEKVIKMIDDMVVLLKKEQTNDDDKKEYCGIVADTLDDKKKGLERSVSDAEKAIADATESIATLGDEIKALADGIKALDKSVAEASEQRKEENADFTELMAQDTAAKELLGMAKNRLNKFYNPKLYEPPEASLAEVHVHAHDSEAPGAPPAAPGPYKKKSEESSGVIAMLDALIAELDKEMTVAKAEEENAQEEYETTMKDSKQKRADDAKSIEDKEGAKADTQAALQASKDDKKAAASELMATLEAISGLAGECDWLLQYFDVRKEARTNEIDALGKAKAVLSGADYSLIQTGRRLRGKQ